MSGWNNEEDIKVEVEEYIDTNPDLYKQRSIEAINEKRFKDALKEAQLALKYGNQDLEYHVLTARVLYEMGQYEVCLKYLKSSDLWNRRDDAVLLREEQNYIYYIFACCFRKCGYLADSSDMIIITPDGKGMIPNLKEAVEKKMSSKTILLTAGEYQEENIVFKNTDIEISSVKNQKVYFKNTSFEISNSNVHISDIRVSTVNLKKGDVIFSVGSGSKVLMRNVDVLGGGEEQSCGISVQGGEVNIRQCLIKSSFGVNIESGIANIADTNFERNIIGVGIASEYQDKPKAYIENCEFKDIFGEYAMGIMVGPQGYANVEKCKIMNGNNFGIAVAGSAERGVKAKMDLSNCTLYYNHCNLVVSDEGEAVVCNSTISGASAYGYVVENAKLTLKNCILKRNKQEKCAKGRAIIKTEDITRADNDVVGSSIESAKNTVNTIFGWATGRKLF